MTDKKIEEAAREWLVDEQTFDGADVVTLTDLIEDLIAETVAEKDREIELLIAQKAVWQDESRRHANRVEKAEAELVEARAKYADVMNGSCLNDSHQFADRESLLDALKQARELLERSLDPFDRPGTLEEIRAFLAAHKEEKP